MYSFVEEDPWAETFKSIILIQEDIGKLKGWEGLLSYDNVATQNVRTFPYPNGQATDKCGRKSRQKVGEKATGKSGLKTGQKLQHSSTTYQPIRYS